MMKISRQTLIEERYYTKGFIKQCHLSMCYYICDYYSKLFPILLLLKGVIFLSVI